MKLQKALIGLISFAIVLSAGAALASGGEGWQMPENPGGLPDDFMGSVRNITDWLLGLTALVAVLAIVYGGIVYVASTGDEDRVRNAKKTIKYAIIGLVMAGLAYAIVNVIIGKVLISGGGTDNTQNTPATNEYVM